MANDVYALQLLGHLANQPVENVLHFEADNAMSADPSADAGHLIAAWVLTNRAAWIGLGPSNYTVTGYKARRVNNGGGPTNITIEAPGTVGSLSPASSSALGPCILLPYNDGARWHDGRIFYPGIGDDELDDNQMVGGEPAALAALLAVLIVPITDAPRTFTLGVWSPLNSVFFQVGEISYSLKQGIQNRRLKPVI